LRVIIVGTSEGEAKKQDGAEEEEVAGEGEEGQEGEGRKARGERAGRGRRKGNLAPTVISKTRRLWV